MILHGFASRSSQNTVFPSKNIIFYEKNGPGPAKIPKNPGKLPFNRAPLRGPQRALVRVTLDLLKKLMCPDAAGQHLSFIFTTQHQCLSKNKGPQGHRGH